MALFRRNERGLASRADRRDDTGSGLFMAEGDLVVERALDVGCTPIAVMIDADRPPALLSRFDAWEELPVYAGGDEVRAMVTGLGVPLSIVAVFERPPRPSPDELVRTVRRLVVVEAVDNPVNVGGIVRNAAGLGWEALLLDGTSADPLARRALRVSMGHGVSLPFGRSRTLAEPLDAFAALGGQIVALTPAADAIDLADVPPAARRAILIGSERTGLSDETLRRATIRARIPMMAGVDSLNAAAASAIACYALR